MMRNSCCPEHLALHEILLLMMLPVIALLLLEGAAVDDILL